VSIALGDNVWLRSQEANIKLEGSVDVTTGSLLGTAAPQLALVGTLETTRGTYVLDLAGVVRRLFEVESGTLRFFGDPDFNPTLNIRAVHTVSVVDATSLSNEARIRVILEGTLARPSLRLESADASRYSQSDLLSLLVTGAPSLQQGATGYNAYLSTLFGLFTSRPGDWLRRTFSLDLFQIRGGFASGNLGDAPGVENVFRGTTLAAGKQVGERSFLTLSYGICALFAQQATTPSLAETLELRFEHRLQRGFGVSLSREPGTLSSATCGQRTFTATPPQYGLDLFRAWRF
jgi:translocation and assembly module TamB